MGVAGARVRDRKGAILKGMLCALSALAIMASCAGAPKPGAAKREPEKEAPREADSKSGAEAKPEGELRAAPSPEPAVSFAGEAAASDTSASAKDSAGTAAGAKSAAKPGSAPPSQSGLKAGFSDDNEQFNYFVKFLDQYKSVPHYELAIGERISVQVVDSEGRAVANADVSASAGGKLLAQGRSYSDGVFALYPLELGRPDATSYTIEARAGGVSSRLEVARTGPRKLIMTLPKARAVPAPLPVDVLFVLDTTGSMGEEIERLRSTIEIISANISALKPKPALRFGMVLYKDREDDYDTKVVPLTADLGKFQAALDGVAADGGGDEPEDLQSALHDAVGAINWNKDGIRLGFIVTDASTHLDYGQSYTYASAAREAKAKGIKLFSIGAGGLPIEGEYVLRQVAQYSQGKYIFLTYGESGEASGGTEGSVSHHTGSNFATDKLEAIVIRFVREEIARQSDRPLEADVAYSEARKVEAEAREDTLAKLFAQALQDLSDYSSLGLAPASKLAVMPLVPAQGQAEGENAVQAEYFGSQLSLAASKTKAFTLVERANLQAILGELELQLSGLADEENAAKAGRLLGADYLVTGTLFRSPERYEIFLKLLRVETAEVLSATKARIDVKLGL